MKKYFKISLAIFALLFLVLSCDSEPEHFTVSFDSVGGSKVESIVVESGKTITQPENPTKTGFDFDCWELDGKVFNFSTPITDDITLTAKWEKQAEEIKKYTVTFDTDGGTEIKSIEVKSGEKIEEPEKPTKSGFVFVGWYLNEDVFNFSKPISSDITLKAKWEAVETHTHQFCTEWKSNETQHYHECVCGEKQDAADHAGITVTTKDPTCVTSGEKVTTCTTCNYEMKKEVIPATGNHSWSDWIVDESTQSQRHSCTVCGKEETSGFSEIKEEVIQKAFEYDAIVIDIPFEQTKNSAWINDFTFSIYSISNVRIDIVEETLWNFSFDMIKDSGEKSTYTAVWKQNVEPMTEIFSNIKKDGVAVIEASQDYQDFMLCVEESNKKDMYLKCEFSNTVVKDKEYSGNYVYVLNSNSGYRSVILKDSNGKTLLDYEFGLIKDPHQNLTMYRTYENVEVSKFCVDGVYYTPESVKTYLEALNK